MLKSGNQAKINEPEGKTATEHSSRAAELTTCRISKWGCFSHINHAENSHY
jgi:hypothetical protein